MTLSQVCKTDFLTSVEMNCGLFAASLPPLKATFEGILTRYLGVHMSSKSSRYDTNRNYGGGGYGYASRRSRASRMLEAGVFDGEDSKQMGNTTFVLDSVRNKNGSEDDGLSVESDQRHILRSSEEPGEGGQYITKTVGYTVSEESNTPR